METRANELLFKLQAAFPESDASVLTRLTDKVEDLARYITQVHELTYTEALECIELVRGALRLPEPAAIAAE